MLNKLTYTFYFSVFNNGCKGSLDAKRFPSYAVKAWRELKPLLTSVPTVDQSKTVLCAACEIAEMLYKAEGRQGVKSENTDGYSVTYADEVSIGRKVTEIAVRRLGDTGLLYMGVDGC